MVRVRQWMHGDGSAASVAAEPSRCLLNKTLVVHYARLTQCYFDILNVVLRRLEMDEVDYALPVSIEYGIYEQTRQITISKGGSRSLAIRLTKLYKERPQIIDFIFRLD